MNGLIMRHLLSYACRKPIASMVYGSNAVVVKPALSLAPMIVAAMLSRCGYDDVKSGSATPEQKLYLQECIFMFSCFAPVVIGIVQIIAWRQYKLRGQKDEPIVTATPSLHPASS